MPSCIKIPDYYFDHFYGYRPSGHNPRMYRCNESILRHLYEKQRLNHIPITHRATKVQTDAEIFNLLSSLRKEHF